MVSVLDFNLFFYLLYSAGIVKIKDFTILKYTKGVNCLKNKLKSI